MTITWPTSAAKLCDGNDRGDGKYCGPDNLRIKRVPALIRRMPVEGPGPVYEEAGNDEVTVSFGVSVRCASVSAASTLVATLSAIANTGELALEGSLTLKSAGLLDADVRQNGKGVRADFSFGGHL